MPINIDGSKGIRQNTTEVTKIPVGTTAQRPANPEAGMIRFNTDQGFVEWYDDVGDRWLATSTFPGVVAIGGTVTDITQDGQLFRVHTFTSDGTFDVARGGEVEYLVVAGGGSGGARGGAGGGAGGFLTGSIAVNPSLISVIVGGGGASVTDTGDGTIGNDGLNSQFSTIESVGGGGGGHRGGSIRGAGRDGGSGGGGGGNGLDGGLGTQGQGNDGGDFDPGGGGGAAQPGAEGTSGQNGGDGIFTTINGSNIAYAGGGAGGRPDTFANGGAGGGGDTNSSGVSNSGGGGGGGTNFGSTSGSGGSGIVIVRYRIG